MSKAWKDGAASMAQQISAFVPTIGSEGTHTPFVKALAPPATPAVQPVRVADRVAAVLAAKVRR